MPGLLANCEMTQRPNTALSKPDTADLPGPVGLLARFAAPEPLCHQQTQNSIAGGLCSHIAKQHHETKIHVALLVTVK